MLLKYNAKWNKQFVTSSGDDAPNFCTPQPPPPPPPPFSPLPF